MYKTDTKMKKRQSWKIDNNIRSKRGMSNFAIAFENISIFIGYQKLFRIFGATIIFSPFVSPYYDSIKNILEHGIRSPFFSQFLESKVIVIVELWMSMNYCPLSKYFYHNFVNCYKAEFN